MDIKPAMISSPGTALKWNKVLVQYLLILLLSSVLAYVLSLTLWKHNVNILHTLFEAACVFVAISAFMVLWHTYELNPPAYYIIGFGFLAVAIFDLFHIYYFADLAGAPEKYNDLTLRFWILARLAEAIIILLSTLDVFRKKYNKQIIALIVGILALGISQLVLRLPGFFPHLYGPNGMTAVKIVYEYIIILILLVSLFNLIKHVGKKGEMFVYEHIFMAIFIALPTEFCFTLIQTSNSYWSLLGHILRVIYYYYLYKGIFIGAVTYPYKKLEENNRNMNDILNELPIGLLTYDESMKVAFINRMGEKILGWKAEEVRGWSHDRFFQAIHDGGDEKSVIQPVAEGIVSSSDGIGLYRNRENDLVKLSVDTHKVQNGALVLFDEAKKRQQLRALQLQTQTILNAIHNPVLMTDEMNKIIMCNKPFENMTGLKENDVWGMDVKTLADKLQYQRNRAVDTENPGDEGIEEASLVNGLGDRIEVLLQYSIIHNVEGEVIGAIGILTDITDMKLEQEKLLQQEKLALLGQLGAGIVHETKNYLTTIKGSSQLLHLLTKDPQVVKYVQKIENAVNEVNRIIGDFLTMSKPRPPVLKPTFLNPLIGSLDKMLHGSMLVDGVHITFHLTPEERQITCDEPQIKQVCLNIIKNAVEAMERIDNPLLTITTWYDPDTEEMKAAFSDNGPGISEEERKKIGTPFFTTKEKGTGLGLSVCYQIMRDHGGSIHIQSEIGQGTTFILSFPCRKE